MISASKIPSQLDKYPRNLLSEEERKELFEIREQIQNSKSYQAMEDDQSRLYGNRQRREMQKELGLEPKEEYKSLFGFDPNRDRRALGEDPREYEGEAPSMYDLLERDRKNFYSQYQKPRTGLLNLLGFMKGGMAKKKKKYGYQDGGTVLLNTLLENSSVQSPEPGLFDVGSILSISADQVGGEGGRRYYLGEGQSRMLNMARKKAAMRARQKMASTPQDSIPAALVESYFEQAPEEEKGGFLKKLLGMQEGGAVQDSSMMMQANPFVPFDQRPPSSGEMMSPIPSGMEQGDMMRIIRDEREVLDMQDVELLRQKAQNALTRFQLDSLMQKATLDSLINQGSGDAMRIQRSPNEPFSFPNTPAQENFMQKYKEEMIDPTYFPEGS